MAAVGDRADPPGRVATGPTETVLPEGREAAGVTGEVVVVEEEEGGVKDKAAPPAVPTATPIIHPQEAPGGRAGLGV